MTNNPSNPELPLNPEQLEEVNEWVQHFRSCDEVLDRCRSLADAASRLILRGQLEHYCSEIEVASNSPLFRTMCIIGDGFSAFEVAFAGERYDWTWLGVAMLVLEPTYDQLEKLRTVAKAADDGGWKAAIAQLIEFRRLSDPSYEVDGPNPE